MTTIYKFPLLVTDTQVIEITGEPKFLNIDVQHDIPCIWAEVDPNAPKVKITILTYGTGHPINVPSEERNFIGTYLYRNDLVFHVFRKI